MPWCVPCPQHRRCAAAGARRVPAATPCACMRMDDLKRLRGRAPGGHPIDHLVTGPGGPCTQIRPGARTHPSVTNVRRSMTMT